VQHVLPTAENVQARMIGKARSAVPYLSAISAPPSHPALMCAESGCPDRTTWSLKRHCPCQTLI
jgi:hypothetical protein